MNKWDWNVNHSINIPMLKLVMASLNMSLSKISLTRDWVGLSSVHSATFFFTPSISSSFATYKQGKIVLDTFLQRKNP